MSDGVEFWVNDVADAAPLGTSVRGKVFRGNLKLGDTLRRALIEGAEHEVVLRVEEITVYDVMIDVLSTGLSGRIVVTGEGADVLRPEALLFL